MKHKFIKIGSVHITNYTEEHWESLMQEINKADVLLPKIGKDELTAEQVIIVMVNGFPTFAGVRFVGDGKAIAVTGDNQTIIPLIYYPESFGSYPQGWCMDNILR